jgi:hypothetical protein
MGEHFQRWELLAKPLAFHCGWLEGDMLALWGVFHQQAKEGTDMSANVHAIGVSS